MNTGTTLHFHLPQGWTVRKVATALAREWMAPLRAEPVVKHGRWVVQPVVENPGRTENPLWEPGISTDEYEARMDRTDLSWTVRASFGRGRPTVLAWLTTSLEEPRILQVICSHATLPENLFNPAKLSALLSSSDNGETEGLVSALLTENGFQPVAA